MKKCLKFEKKSKILKIILKFKNIKNKLKLRLKKIFIIFWLNMIKKIKVFSKSNPIIQIKTTNSNQIY